MDLTNEQLDSMSMDELQALLQGGDMPPAQDEQEASSEAATKATPETDDPTLNADGGPIEAATARGVPDDRFAQLREQERALAEAQRQIQAYEEALSDPNRVRAHLAAIAPGEPPSFDDDPDAALQARLAPIMQRMQALEAENQSHRQRAEHQQMLDHMHAKHGPDFSAKLAMFDQANPHFVEQGVHPELRYFAARGLESATQKQDPAADEARINAAAEAKLAKILASGGASGRGIPTLGDLPSARESRQAPALDSLSQQDMERMSASELQAMLRGGG